MARLRAVAHRLTRSPYEKYEPPSHVVATATLTVRRDGRVVDGGGLENHCTGNRTGGSNPSPSARFKQAYTIPNFNRLSAAATMASSRGRGVQPSTRCAFALVAFRTLPSIGSS